MPSPRPDAQDTKSTANLPVPLPDAEGRELEVWSEWKVVQNRYTALRSVVFEDHGENVRLCGSVPSHYLKQVALAAACELAGSRPIINEIQVVRPAAPRHASTRHRFATDTLVAGQSFSRWREAASRPSPT